MRIAQKFVFVTMLLLACFVSPAFAQGNMGAGRLYNPNTETTAKGTVEKVSEIAGRGNWNGIHLNLQADGQTYDVHVGPSYYLSTSDFTFSVGDQIEVTGSKITLNSADALIAREIKKDDKVLTLRNHQGVPSWSRGRLRAN